jgi:hypothetical protein
MKMKGMNSPPHPVSAPRPPGAKTSRAAVAYVFVFSDDATLM